LTIYGGLEDNFVVSHDNKVIFGTQKNSYPEDVTTAFVSIDITNVKNPLIKQINFKKEGSYKGDILKLFLSKDSKTLFLLTDQICSYNVTNLKNIKRLKEICEHNCLGPSTKSIVDEAVKRNIPWLRLGTDSMIQLGYGASQMRFQATTTCKTNVLAVGLAGDKHRTKQILGAAAIPVPKGSVCTDEVSLKAIVDAIGYPLVIKPLDGNQGKGATINITRWEQAVEALSIAQNFSRRVIAEQFITGHDFRVLVIDNKFVAAAKRVPAHVVGNGKDSIATLVDVVNFDTRRGNGHENVLTKIRLGADTDELLIKQGYALEGVPPMGEIIYLKGTANLSTGGSSIDVTDEVHPENIFLAERIAKIIGLDICGIDIMAPDLAEPLSSN
ncbi:MAG: ATP-grasp domain-containing protein, partial [Sphingobacteriales bacterium]